MFMLMHAGRALEDKLEAALAGVGLSLAKQSVLTRLVNAGAPLSLGELAAQQSCVRSNMTQLVDRLEADGLVKRIDDPDDRRSVRAALTREGEARQASGAEQIARVQTAFTASLPKSERQALAKLLASLE